MSNAAGGGGGGHFEVTPAELRSAAGTLRGVHGELFHTATHGAGDLGSPELEGAVEHLSQRAAQIAGALEMAVVAAAGNADSAAGAYEQTDQTAMGAAGYEGPH